MPGRQQKIESIRDQIRSAVWTVVITGNDCNRFEIDPIWTQSGFKLNQTNLSRSQSIYMWTRSYFKNQRRNIYLLSTCLNDVKSIFFNIYMYFLHISKSILKIYVADERSIRQKNTIMSLRYWHVLLFNKYIFYMSFIDTLLKSDHGQFLT